MRHGQKNLLFGPPHGEGRFGADGVDAIVEGDERIGAAFVYAQVDAGRVGDDHRAHGQVVRRQRRDNQAGAGGRHDRAARAERIGRRARGGGDDDPVAVVGGDHLTVDVGLYRKHVGSVAADGHFVEGQPAVGVSGEAALHFEHRPRLDRQLAAGYLAENLFQPLVRGSGEESQVPGVDAQHGYGGAAQPVHPFEQGAVAAVAHHDRAFGLRADALAVDAVGRDFQPDCCADRFGELFVDQEPQSGGPEGVEQLAEFFGAAGGAAAGKKYDFHRRSFKKSK